MSAPVTDETLHEWLAERRANADPPERDVLDALDRCVENSSRGWYDDEWGDDEPGEPIPRAAGQWGVGNTIRTTALALLDHVPGAEASYNRAAIRARGIIRIDTDDQPILRLVRPPLNERGGWEIECHVCHGAGVIDHGPEDGETLCRECRR